MSRPNKYTEEQKTWIAENYNIRVWKNKKEFTDVFNILFKSNMTEAYMNKYLYENNFSILSAQNIDNYTQEMKDWLTDNYANYNSFVDLAYDFNRIFHVNYSNCRLAKYCQRHLKIHTPKPKSALNNGAKPHQGGNRYANAGMFKSGERNCYHNLPVGTLRYNSDGRPFIKVKEDDGKNSANFRSQRGHNFVEPYWKPLQKKIWEDHYGPVPEGFVICSLNKNPLDENIDHIGCLDKRGTARMAKHEWWTDNVEITRLGVMWCNLYYLLKDRGVKLDYGK